MSREPTRLADLRDAPSPETEFMGGIIRTHRATRRPPEGKMQELAGRLGPVLEERSASPLRTMPWLGLSMVAIVILTGAVWISRPKDHGAPTSASVTTQVPQVQEAPTAQPATRPATVDAPPPAAAISVDALPSVNTQKAPAVSPPRCDEIDLVDRADTKLRSGDPAAALAVAREHEQRCPAGVLVQERERIAIEALAKLGRVDAAKARAHTFEERFPSSPHLRRVRQVVAELPR